MLMRIEGRARKLSTRDYSYIKPCKCKPSVYLGGRGKTEYQAEEIMCVNAERYKRAVKFRK